MSQLSAAQQEVQRVLVEVHNEYYRKRPDPTIALRGYLDESLSLNRPEEEELDASFEACCTAYIPASTPPLPSVHIGSGIYHSAGNVSGHDTQGGAAEVIDTSAHTTIPTYRFCRPVERTVYRKIELFTTFTPAVMLDEGKYEEYREELLHSEWLSEQPGRRPADDIIAIEAYRRLTSLTNPSRLSRRKIDNTRQLPLHSDMILDMDLLRDLPPFPGQRTWDDTPIPGKDEFSDGIMAYEDTKEQFCTSAGSRTYACTMHAECSSTVVTLPFSRPPIPARSSPCSRSCVLARGGASSQSAEMTPAELGILRSCLKAQADVQSCALRSVFPRTTCAAIDTTIRSLLIENVPEAVPTSSTSISPRCNCYRCPGSGQSSSSSKRKWYHASSCACREAGWECIPELCHPINEVENWSEPVTSKPLIIPARGCSDRIAERPLAQVTQVRISPIAGYGLFATTDLPKGTALFVYQGELFYDNEVENRSLFYDFDRRNYLYTLLSRKKQDKPDITVDAGQRGNESRFINTNTTCRDKINCVSRYWHILGERKLLIKTTKTIAKNEELFLDYGKEFVLKIDQKEGDPVKSTSLVKPKHKRPRKGVED